MAIDFPLPPLRTFLWDHLSEIVSPDGDQQRRQHAQSPQGGGGGGGGGGSNGVSRSWQAGTGHEGFDGFRIELKKFSSGQSNPTFLLKVHLSPPPAASGARAGPTTTRFVLRKKPSSVTVSSAHAVEREFLILRALHATSDVPVPRALLLCVDAAVIGTPFYVMEFVEGRIFSDAALPGLEPAERAAVYESAAETLARLHHVDFVRADLRGFGRSKGGYLGRQVATLERVATKQAEDAGPIEGFGDVVRDLGGLIASGSVVQDRVTIVHGDFRIDNLVFHPVEPRVIAVLDWELSTLGHPLADLANLCILHHLPASASALAATAASNGVHEGRGSDGRPPTLSPPPFPPSPLAGLKGLDLEALGIPRQSELMAAYRRAASAFVARGGGDLGLVGVSGPGAAELGLAFVFFKMSVIAHGVKARQARGVASSAQASLVSAMVPAMIALAKEQVSALKHILATRGTPRNSDDDEGDGGGGDGSGGCRKEGLRREPVPPLPRPKAVLFDVGGVLSESPLLAILEFERGAHPRPLPSSYVGVAIAAAGEGGLFQRLERGEERLGSRFLERFAEYLVSDKAKRAYVDWYVARRWTKDKKSTSSSSSSSLSPAARQRGYESPPAPRAATNVVARSERGGGRRSMKQEAEAAVAGIVAVDVPELFRRIAAAARVPVPKMIAAAEALRRQGFLLGAVSNDFLVEPGFALGQPRQRENKSTSAVEAGSDEGDGSGGGGGVYSRLPSLCDVVVLSSTTGSRKPSRKIYEDACQALGVSASEAVFVDDIRENIRAAEALGMRTVWVHSGRSVGAVLSELEATTGVSLVASPEGGEAIRQPPGKL